MKTYFIVFYTGIFTDENLNIKIFNGHMDVETDGSYLSHSETIRDIKKICEEKGCKNPIINNIIELNKKQFKSWQK